MNANMSSSDVPLVVLTAYKSQDAAVTPDNDINDICDSNDVMLHSNDVMLDSNDVMLDSNDFMLDSNDGMLGSNDFMLDINSQGISDRTVDDPDRDEEDDDSFVDETTAANAASNQKTITNNRKPSNCNSCNRIQYVKRTASVRSEGPPSYHSLFSGSDRRGTKTRLSLPSARDAFRRFSDALRQGTPRSSTTSVYPESPASLTTLTGFIIRDKNAEGETQTRQVLRLASVLLLCGAIILILEVVSCFHTHTLDTGYSYAGIGAGLMISCTGVLGISASTRKDCPQKYFSCYKGLSLISLLAGIVVLCGTLANLDVRWLSHPSQVANIGEIVLYITKVLLAGVDIAAGLASIYI